MDCSMPLFPVHHQLHSLLKLMSIELVMPSNHLILCHPLLLCFQSSPAPGSFQVNQFFASGGQSIEVSTSASVLPMKIQDWFPLGWTGCISFSTGKTIALTRWTLVGKVMSLLFNMLSSLVITFLPRSKHHLISWLQSPSAVILEPQN